ncbi:Oxidoreductase family, NAD-binding Rossmann fold [Allorhodopirellula heiligendammensis]|uniref:Oxidoreductase family, NAD-binding Rossmann fold n=2 Tax=Allorhodopirellula heiligendammensis TaxID=2714739 RepID=A0A5C6BDQ1_9BACT|nr:Oxidoreductase family, NAD-binding Rossmann fold [Allorhodopirellula heiligendammensis]
MAPRTIDFHSQPASEDFFHFLAGRIAFMREILVANSFARAVCCLKLSRLLSPVNRRPTATGRTVDARWPWGSQVGKGLCWAQFHFSRHIPGSACQSLEQFVSGERNDALTMPRDNFRRVNANVDSCTVLQLRLGSLDMRLKFSVLCCCVLPCLLVATGFSSSPLQAQSSEQTAPEIRLGIIGLDTSHSPAIIKTFNNPEPTDKIFAGFRVVAAYPFGSQTIESSASRIPQYTTEAQEQGVEIVDSIADLLSKVDCVFLETNDGQLHLEQALQVFQAGKPVFIDKPTGSNLAETIAIFRAAEHYQVPMFSASSLRYTEGAQAIRAGKIGRVLGCSTYSPCSLEPAHVDLFWYGIHGVETLFTCMGTGCLSVQHTETETCQFSVGTWDGGRVGTFRGIQSGRSGYGGTAFGDKAIMDVGSYAGYEPLFIEVAKFFHSHEPPVSSQETIEIYAFMQAAFASKHRGGSMIEIAEVMKAAIADAEQLLEGKLVEPSK